MFETLSEAIGAREVAEFAERLRCVARNLDDEARVELLRELEALKSTCAAAQAKTAADLYRHRRVERAARGVPADEQDRGIAAEVALARRDSPNRGGRHLGLARALVEEMPHTLALLDSGVLNEWRASILVRETACLTRDDRVAIDRELCADASNVDGLGDRALTAKVREHAARRDAAAMVDRASKAVADRRVTTRPAPDTMAYVTALLPVDQAVAVQARLGRDADTIVAEGDPRTRTQIMADLLVGRVAGIDPAHGPAIAVNLVISDEALFGVGSESTHLDGYGPIPPVLARRWVSRADRESLAQLRRVYARPETGALTATESRARCFPTGLARYIDIRDRVCRTPWCDAPIRHHDHIAAYVDDGPTNAANGAGLCAACNYAKQGEGWYTETEAADRHSYRVTTPSGHHYRSTAPPLPAPLEFGIEKYSPVERELHVALVA